MTVESIFREVTKLAGSQYSEDSARVRRCCDIVYIAVDPSERLKSNRFLTADDTPTFIYARASALTHTQGHKMISRCNEGTNFSDLPNCQTGTKDSKTRPESSVKLKLTVNFKDSSCEHGCKMSKRRL